MGIVWKRAISRHRRLWARIVEHVGSRPTTAGPAGTHGWFASVVPGARDLPVILSALNRFPISVRIQRHHGNHREYDVQRWNGHGCGEEVRVLRRIGVEWRKMPRRACMVTYRRGCCSIRRQASQVVWESVHDDYDVTCVRRHGRHEGEEGMRRCVSAAAEAVTTRRFAYSLVGAYIFFLLR